MILPVTLTISAAAGIANLMLAMRVAQVRISGKVMIGDGGDPRLLARTRAHANFVEYAPFIIILIGLLEFTTGTSLWLWIASALFLLARVAHPLGMDGLPAGRMIGTLLTFLLLLGLGGYAVTLPFLPHSSGGTPAVSVMPAG